MELSLKDLSSEELEAIAEEIRQRLFDMGSVEQPTYRADVRRQLIERVEPLRNDDAISFTFTLHLIAQDIFQMLGRIRRTKEAL